MTLSEERSGRAWRELVHLAVLVAAAGVLRLMAVGLRKGYLGFDESMYIVLGKNLVSGAPYYLNGLPNVTFPFGMPLLAGAFWKLTSSARWAVSLPTAIFGALGVVPIYLICRDIWDRLAGFTAAVLYAGFPALLFMSPFCRYSERLYAGWKRFSPFSFFRPGASCSGRCKRRR